MDPETYQQSLREGSAESARLIVELGRVVIGAAVVAACLWFGWLWHASLGDKLNVSFARAGDLRFPRLPVGRVVVTFFEGVGWFAVSITVAIRAPVGWLATSRLTALLAASATVGIGVFLHEFHLVEVRWGGCRSRTTRRFWHRTPAQMAAVLG